MAINVVQLTKDITNAASEALGQDVTTLRNFSERQVEFIALQTAFIERGIKMGEITEATRDYFLNSLEGMARNFVNTLGGMQSVVKEKVYNAVAKTIWNVLKNIPGMPPFIVYSVSPLTRYQFSIPPWSVCFFAITPGRVVCHVFGG